MAVSALPRPIFDDQLVSTSTTDCLANASKTMLILVNETFRFRSLPPQPHHLKSAGLPHTLSGVDD